MSSATRHAALLLLAAIATSCSSNTGTSKPTASPSPTAAVLTENSTCAEYQQATRAEQDRFLTNEVVAHTPQTNASMTIPPMFNSGSPTVVNGNTFVNTGVVVFLHTSLQTSCPQNPSARLGDLLAPAWVPAPSP
jgi:hypothetical protein